MTVDSQSMHKTLAQIRAKLDDMPKQRSFCLLIVEDDDSDLRLLLDVLDEYRTDIHIARTEAEAIDCLMLKEIDLVFLDLKLMQGDGLSLLDWLRLNRPKLPVIVLTGLDGDSPQLQGAVDRGACIFPKPFTVDHARMVLGTL